MRVCAVQALRASTLGLHMVAVGVFVLALFLAPMRGHAQDGRTASQIVEVGSDTEFAAALQSVMNGGTIALRPGTFRDLRIVDYAPRGPVRIIAMDRSSPPTVNRVAITRSRGLSLEGLRFVAAGDEPQSSYLLTIERSQDIGVQSSRFVARENQGDKRVRGLLASDVTGLRFADNRVDGLERAAVFNRGRDIVVEHNLVERMTTDGFNFFEVQNVDILSNSFRGFKVDPGIQADFVQFWTNRAVIPTTNVRIRFNVMIQDLPDPVQGIFIRSEHDVPYDKIEITDNIILTGSPHAITLDLATNSVIERNLVADVVGSRFNAAIRALRLRDSRVAGNVAVAYVVADGTAVTTRENVMLARANDNLRRTIAQRVSERLVTPSNAPVTGRRAVTPEHRAAGPRTP